MFVALLYYKCRTSVLIFAFFIHIYNSLCVCFSGGEAWSVLCSEAVLQLIGRAAWADGWCWATCLLDEHCAWWVQPGECFEHATLRRELVLWILSLLVLMWAWWKWPLNNIVVIVVIGHFKSLNNVKILWVGSTWRLHLFSNDWTALLTITNSSSLFVACMPPVQHLKSNHTENHHRTMTNISMR